MNREERKLKSLLKYYYDKSVPITLDLKHINHEPIRGKIIKKNVFGLKYIIIKREYKTPLKIFIEEIEEGSIIPLDYEKIKIKNNSQKRNPLPAKLRYKILKRDRFTCMGCGARAPDVELEVDHIIPLSRGGTDDEKNLITKCLSCNRGKGDLV